MNAEERLKEYVERDEIYKEYKKDKLMNPSDFEIFCIQHCKDTEEILEENQELKKQLEGTEKCLKDMYHINIENDKELENVKTKQKEFIEWLEDYINRYDDIDICEQGGCNTIKEILQKYRSIIGENDV